MRRTACPPRNWIPFSDSGASKEIAAAALVTGISSGASNLHVAENLDKLIDLTAQLGVVVNDLDQKAELMNEGPEPHRIETEMWRIKSTAARLNPGPAARRPRPASAVVRTSDNRREVDTAIVSSVFPAGTQALGLPRGAAPRAPAGSERAGQPAP